MSLRGWPGFPVLRLAIVWIVLVAMVTLWRWYYMLPQALDREVAAVRIDLKGPILLALGPPLLFFAVAYVWHRKAQR